MMADLRHVVFSLFRLKIQQCEHAKTLILMSIYATRKMSPRLPLSVIIFVLVLRDDYNTFSIEN